MAKRQHPKGGRRSAPSKTTTPIAVRIPNDLLEDLWRVAGAMQRETQSVYYPDKSAAARKASILEALSALVEGRLDQNRRFLDRLDVRRRERERFLGLCTDRLTEPDPPYARRQLVVRADPREETLLIGCWPRRPVGRLEDVPQGSGKVPTHQPVWLRLRRFPEKARR